MNQFSEFRYLNFNINYMALHSEDGYIDTIYPQAYMIWESP